MSFTSPSRRPRTGLRPSPLWTAFLSICSSTTFFVWATELSVSTTALSKALDACPPPQPCNCQCECDAVTYGTPAPPPAFMQEGEEASISGGARTAVEDVREREASSDSPHGSFLQKRQVPPPVDRSGCPEVGACNCFCPCRDF
ncbi:unnamed protein product [Amoebophrya sp. A25]|nr:unnamed protein product [Amoebophrya sp. A25]|eukprot:GSA25T00003685001.1